MANATPAMDASCRDADNNLVTVEGFSVLDNNGQAIQLPDGDFAVAPDGNISVNGQQVAQLGFGVFQNPQTELKHTEGNLFTGPAASTSQDVPARDARLFGNIECKSIATDDATRRSCSFV